MMHWGEYGWGWGMGFGGLFMLIPLVLVIVGIAYFIKMIARGEKRKKQLLIF